jgi:hypothetical protein
MEHGNGTCDCDLLENDKDLVFFNQVLARVILFQPYRQCIYTYFVEGGSEYITVRAACVL